jgi:prevent-host-death family protein
MKIWQLQEAKSKFSQVINMADHEPQEITKNGKTVAFIVSSRDFEAYKKPSPLEVLQSYPHRGLELNIERNQDSIRDISL